MKEAERAICTKWQANMYAWPIKRASRLGFHTLIHVVSNEPVLISNHRASFVTKFLPCLPNSWGKVTHRSVQICGQNKLEPSPNPVAGPLPRYGVPGWNAMSLQKPEICQASDIKSGRKPLHLLEKWEASEECNKNNKNFNKSSCFYPLKKPLSAKSKCFKIPPSTSPSLWSSSDRCCLTSQETDGSPTTQDVFQNLWVPSPPFAFQRSLQRSDLQRSPFYHFFAVSRGSKRSKP